MRLATLLCVSLLPLCVSAETLVYVGTYTRGDSASNGIYVSKLDESSGALSEPVLAAAADNPSFVGVAHYGTAKTARWHWARSSTPFPSRPGKRATAPPSA